MQQTSGGGKQHMLLQLIHRILWPNIFKRISKAILSGFLKNISHPIGVTTKVLDVPWHPMEGSYLCDIFHPYSFCFVQVHFTFLKFNAHLVSQHLIARSLSLDIQTAQDWHSEVWSHQNNLGNIDYENNGNGVDSTLSKVFASSNGWQQVSQLANQSYRHKIVLKTWEAPLCLAEVQDHRGGESRCQTRSRRRGRRPSLATKCQPLHGRCCSQCPPLFGQRMESRCSDGEHPPYPLWGKE